MPRVDFSFQGWVRGAEITSAMDNNGNDVDVSEMDPRVLADKLEKGVLSISLGDYLYKDNTDAEIEIFDYEVE